MEEHLTLATKAIAAARSRIQDCNAQINAYSEADEHFEDYHRDEYLEDAGKILKSSTLAALASVRIVFELLGLKAALKAFEKEFESVSNTMGKVEYFDEYIGPHNEAVDLLSSRLAILRPLLETPSAVLEQRKLLSRMLRQVPHYIEGMSHHQKREKDVQDDLSLVLRLSFPDVIREPTVAKQTKTYCPDFGIESIGTAVEVKFATDKTKAKSVIGELYEDMKGYAGSEFSFFCALVYMTGNFLTQDQVDAELRKVESPKEWKVFLVVGAGGKKA